MFAGGGGWELARQRGVRVRPLVLYFKVLNSGHSRAIYMIVFQFRVTIYLLLHVVGAAHTTFKSTLPKAAKGD